MPKFEVSQCGNEQELVFKPSDGDLRCSSFGLFERYQSGIWSYIGDIDQLFREFELQKTKVVDITNWMIEQQEKDRLALIKNDLESQFDDLAKAGNHLRQLEKMLRIARKTYDSMTEEVEDRLKTFERLDTPYPDDEAGPGYSI